MGKEKGGKIVKVESGRGVGEVQLKEQGGRLTYRRGVEVEPGGKGRREKKLTTEEKKTPGGREGQVLST